MRVLTKVQQDVLAKMAEYKAVLEDVLVESGTHYGCLRRPYEEPELIRYKTLDALIKAGCIKREPNGTFTLLPVDRQQGVVKPCVLRWDSSDYYLTDEEFLAQEAEAQGHVTDIDEDGNETDEELEWREHTLNGKDLILGEDEECMWVETCDELSDLMTVFPSSYLRAEVNGFGWLHQDGSKTFKADEGRELLREILPNTDCTWEVYHYTEPFTGKKGLAIQNWHHDAPTGGEWYYITERGDEDAE